MMVDRSDLDTITRIIKTRGGFGHREHLELAWNYLGAGEPEDAYRRVRAAIQHVAVLHGEPDRFHETITRAWVRLVAVHRAGSEARSFDEFIAGNSGLLDGSLLGRHYSRELIGSSDARAQWLEPDLRPLPLAT